MHFERRSPGARSPWSMRPGPIASPPRRHPSWRQGGRNARAITIAAPGPVLRADAPAAFGSGDVGTRVAMLAVMRSHLVPCAFGLATVVAIACGSSTNDAVGSSGEAVSAGQIFNFGALAHPGSCMDARGAGTADGTQIQEWACN